MKIANRQAPGSGSGAQAGSRSIFLSRWAIKDRVEDLGAQISDHYLDRLEPIVFLVVLEGAMVFAADLMRRLTIPFEVQTIRCKSYKDGKQSGHLKITQDPILDLRQRQILIVEDIIDSGLTIKRLIQRIEEETMDIRVVTLLERRGRDKIPADYWVGFKIPAGFVYGYGLDDEDGTGRGLKDIWVKGVDLL